MTPKILSDLFSEDMLWLFKKQIAQIKTDPVFSDPSFAEDIGRFFRKEYHRHPLFEVMHEYLLEKVNRLNLFGEPVKRSYSLVAMYDNPKSICPLHTDRPQCKYTIDLCIDFKTSWPLYILDKPFILGRGDAVLYSGTDHPHYRNQIEYGNFCDLVFFHFVPTTFQGSLD